MKKMSHYRPTKAVIDIQAIKQNVANLREFLQPHVQIVAVVKANAYGHGDVQVAKVAMEAGATVLAVATPEEAIHMREHFPSVDILVLGASPVSFAPYAAANNILLTVFSAQWIREAHQLLTNNDLLKLHIKIDSGMGRIGVTDEQQLQQLLDAIHAANSFQIDGIFTHFATADEEDTTYFDNQIKRFEQLLATLPVKPRLVHIANTATALLKDSKLQYDAVRFGISMYGLAPSPYVAQHLPFPIKEALTLESELVHVKLLRKGESVGYGATFIAEEDCYIGTLPIGYADGMVRGLSGERVIIDGQYAKIIGRICMDQCMILLPAAYNVGEKVILIGRDQGKVVTIDDWANKLGTINYEIPCILSQRIPRVYI